MGRVEKRRYRRKRRHLRRVLLGLMLLLTVCGALRVLGRDPVRFVTERLGGNGIASLQGDFDRTAQTREVTLPEESWYAIQTGIFSTADAAEEKAGAYTSRGAPGVVVQDGEKWRVFIACYGAESDASAVRTRLQERQEVDTYLYVWRCPELRLRLSGMAGQLDAVEAGFTLLTSTAAALRDMAVELDAAQVTHAEALTQVKALDGQISLWEKTIRSRFDGRLPDLVQGMLSVTANWAQRYDTLMASADTTALSAALKAQGMGMFADVIAWRTQVAAE